MIFDSLFLSSLLKSFLYFILFIFAVFTAFYIPGKIVIGKSLDNFQSGFGKFILELTVGMVLFAYQGAIFGYLGMRFLSYIYLIIFFILWCKQQPLRISVLTYLKKIKSYKINCLFIVIFLIGIFGQTQQFFVTGLELSDGIHILTSASDDAFWHTSLIEQITRRFPPFEPGLVGVYVRNYHYWSNLLIAEIIRVFQLPLLQTQYQFMYIFISFLLGGSAYTLGRILKFSSVGLILIVYLQYFASDMIYLLTAFTSRSFIFDIQPLEDGTMFLENPPRAFAAVVVFCGIAFLIQWIRYKRFRTGFITALLLGIIVGLKVHTGITVLGGLAGLSLYFLMRRQLRLLFIPIIAAIISCLIYYPVNGNSGLPIFAPFEMSRMFAVQPNLNLSHFELARRIYADHHNFLQVLRMEITMLVIFMVAQFGVRNIGFLPLKTTIKSLGMQVSVFFYFAISTALIVGTIFYQPVAGADIFNFYLAASLFLSIISALTISNWFNQGGMFIKMALIILLLIVSMPRWIYKTQTFGAYFKSDSLIVSRGELTAMEFLRAHTKSKDIVLVFNKGQWDSMYSYVSPFIRRDTFLSGQGILGRHGIPFDDREKIVNTITLSKDIHQIRQLLKNNRINILYFYGQPTLAVPIERLPVEAIFKGDIYIYRVEV